MNDKAVRKPKADAKAETVDKEPVANTQQESVAPPARPTKPSKTGPLEIPQSVAKGGASKTPAIEEAIEIALEAASTAVDSAQEIQRLRSESFKLITDTRKSSRLLLYSATLIFGLAAIAVFSSLVYFKRAMNDFDLITKVNRDSLLVFAGEINGLVEIGKKIDVNVNNSSQALQAITAAHSDLSNRVQTLTASLATANASITKLALQEKEFSSMRQSLDELSSATRSANARANDALANNARLVAARQPSPSQVAQPRPQRQAATRAPPPRPAGATATTPRDSMIRYP
jgi:uncharacterized phage infection (PIP) family protein YhgE